MNEIDAELRTAVREYGNSVEPADRLGAIRRATGERPSRARSWQPWVLAGGAAGVAASVVMGTLLLTDPSGTKDTPVVATRSVTVYTVEQVGENLWLLPERADAADTGDEVADAVGALIADSDAEQVSDRWFGCPYGHLESVVVAADSVTVKLAGGGAVCGWDHPGAEEAQYQQLAWTVREAVGTDLPVVLARDGEPITPQPITADPAALSPVLIDAPADGATVSSPVELRGTSDTFEANVPWQVLQDGEVVADGFTMGGSYGDRRPWRDTVELPAGDYTLRVWEDSAEDGSLRAEDTVSFTVE